MAKTNVKQNIPDFSDEYELVPRTHIRRKRSELRVLGTVYSSLKQSSTPTAPISYADFMSRTSFSRATVSRAVKAISNDGLLTVKKNYHKKAEYTAEDIAGGYVQVEKFFHTNTFYIPQEERERKLKPNEIIVLAHIATVLKNPDTPKFTGSIASISKTVGACEKTVKNALDALISARILFCNTSYQWQRHDKVLSFAARSSLLRLMRHRRKDAPTNAASEEAVHAADMRSERDRHFARLRDEALWRPTRILEYLQSDDTYKAADSAVRRLEMKIGIAEVKEPAKVPDLKAHLFEAVQARTKRLHELHYTEDDLIPKFHCTKCSDTGYLPNGRPCDCFST